VRKSFPPEGKNRHRREDEKNPAEENIVSLIRAEDSEEGATFSFDAESPAEGEIFVFVSPSRTSSPPTLADDRGGAS
jgi:hypothetical protein